MALSTDLVSYYKLDVDSSTQTDSVGSNDGTVTGATYTSSGKISGAYNFDGSNDSIDTSYDFSTSAFSISLWFNSDGAQNKQMVGCWDGANHRVFLQLRNDGTNFLRFNLRTGGGVDYRADYTTAISNSTWYHVVATYDGSNVKIYVDGDLKDTTSATGTSATDTGFKIGTALSSWFDGIIDEVGIWERGLTSTEVTELYNSGDGLQYPFTTPSGGIAKVNGVAWADIAKINGVTKANIAKMNGVSTS